MLCADRSPGAGRVNASPRRAGRTARAARVGALLGLLGLVFALSAPSAAAQLAPPWTDKGGGLPGEAGIPRLLGSGELVPGTPGQIQLVDARPSSNCAIYFSLLEVGVPVKGGTLSAYPPMLVASLVTGPNGAVLLPWAAWPAALPPGVELFFQFLVADPAAVQGVSISNLLMGVTG